MYWKHPLVSSPLLLFLFGIAGCSDGAKPDLGYVEGTVTVNGQPASLIMVQFQPMEQGQSPSYGFADAKGRYKLQFTGTRRGAVLGAHTIRLTFDDDPSPDGPVAQIQIPAEYNERSELKVEVKRGNNRHDFHLRVDQGLTQTASK